MTIFAKPIVNTKLNLKRNKYNEGRGSIPLPFIFLLRSPYTDDDYDAWVVWSGGAVRSSDYVYSSYGLSPDNDWISRDDYVLYVNLDGSLGDVYDVERSYGYKLDSISGHKLEKLFS